MRDRQEFFIDRFLMEADLSNEKSRPTKEKQNDFQATCESVKSYIDMKSHNLTENELTAYVELQKQAIIGIKDAVKKITQDVKDALINLNLSSEDYPSYYHSLPEAVFAELYGLSALTPWVNDYTEEYKKSSSAKLIGENLYCMIDGKAVKQPQKISKARRQQLRHALLLAYPKERSEAGHNEIYLLREDGKKIRVTIMGGSFTPEDNDVMVFRKYIIAEEDTLSFEYLASKGTFPKECIPLLENLVKMGPNVFFCGEVRSGKTTFLQVWQHYEDPTLEGTTVSSDEETDYSEITQGPLVQIIADDDKLDQVEKSLKRLDSNYIILSEVRGAAEYRFFLGITNMGTRRCKCTIHDNSAVNFPYKMATEIVTAYGGNQEATIMQLYSNIDYVFELCEIPEDRSKKRLKGIVELRYDTINDVCSAHRICSYDPQNGIWRWKCDIGRDKKELALGYEKEFAEFERILRELEKSSPLEGESVIYPAYYRANEKMRKEILA